MHNYSGCIDALYTGQIKPIGPNDTPSGIYKEQVDGPCFLSETGLQGDMQADKRVHGGPEKALYHFPAENYAFLKQALPHLADSFIPGSIGENLSSKAVDDKHVHIGDIIALGGAVVQVSQPRRPCWKVNHKYGNAHIAALMMSQCITGWYYRVLEEGEIVAGDTFRLQERLPDSLSVHKLWLIFRQRLESNSPQKDNVRAIPGLSLEWVFG